MGSSLPRPGRADDLELTAPGWDRSAAIAAVDALHSQGTPVEAVHVVRTICGQAEYVLQQWHFERAPGESDGMAGEHSRNLAEEFIEAFTDPGDGTVTYVLFTTDESGRLHRAA